MQKTALIIGLGFQGKKYVEFFTNNGYIIDGVSKSGENKQFIQGIRNVISAQELKEKLNMLGSFYLDTYDYIVGAVYPLKSQEKIIKKLLLFPFTSKIIIEKPVSYNVSFLEMLIEDERCYFFIDEVILDRYYKKIFSRRIDTIKSYIYYNSKQSPLDILEHAFGGFLLFQNIEEIFLASDICIRKQKIDNYLFYNIILNQRISILFIKGYFKVMDDLIKELHFGSSLEYILSLDSAQNKICKQNFMKLRVFLNSLK